MLEIEVMAVWGPQPDLVEVVGIELGVADSFEAHPSVADELGFVATVVAVWAHDVAVVLE